ncbi:hypothetical protein ALC152_22290 [Arcobacter sp. 15-2]|uniref:hypothetical protein n=1 Tax=Arcobacter sp. 15-2 TaxID=3374109 RepID=UPI00399D3E6E
MEVNIKLFEQFFAQIEIRKEENNYLSPVTLDSQNRKVNDYQIIKRTRHLKRLVNVNLQTENDKVIILFKGLDIKVFSRLLIEFTNNKLNSKLEYKFENSLIFTISSINNIPNLLINDTINIDKLTAKIMIDKLEYLFKCCSFSELELDEY